MGCAMPRTKQPGEDDTAKKWAPLAPSPGVITPQDAVDQTPRKVSFFISYAHEDQKLKKDLLKRLQPHLDSAARYRFSSWQDSKIKAGSDWKAAILNELERCDFGLLLVSPAFLASTFITTHELVKFVGAERGEGKLCVPVALKPIRFDGHTNLQGLERHQIFHDEQQKSFSVRTTPQTKDAFAFSLFPAIIEALDHHFIMPAPSQPTAPQHRDGAHFRHLADKLGDLCMIEGDAQAVTQDKLEGGQGERQAVLKFLGDWIRDSEGQRYCALLGDTGMGKTTSCRALWRDNLNERARQSG